MMSDEAIAVVLYFKGLGPLSKDQERLLREAEDIVTNMATRVFAERMSRNPAYD